MTRFATATCDELWSGGRLLERRLSWGEAVEDAHGLFARDERDDALVARCEAVIEALRRMIPEDVRVRLVAEVSTDGESGTIAATAGGRSVITTADHFDRDLVLLREAARPAEAERPSQPLPIVWRNGTGAVLLHEAAGHPLEHGHEPIAWPSWLSLEIPLAMRRATFRDVPLLRMSHVTARQNGAPFELPPERIEVLLVDGGAYDPLTEIVTIRVGAADLLSGKQRTRLRPFSIVHSRREVAQMMAGASGEPLRYPGVVCSREGQELVVPASAPVILTVSA